ncbi:MAG: OmpH family outer membrane protein, partial [Rhodobacteraceae bacterium]|nr:OmpH family outer membrane protein [Paracoccaceae bacterium]
MPLGRDLGLVWGLLVAAPFALSAAPIWAEGAAPAAPIGPVRRATPLLTLDQDRLFSQSKMGQAIEARFAAASKTLIDENRRIESDLEQEERDLTARRPTMAPADFAPLASAFDTKVEAI